jgi:hypothetical protein
MTTSSLSAAWFFRRGCRLSRLVLSAHLRGAFPRASLLSHLRSAYFARWHALLLERQSHHLAERRRREADHHLHAARTIARSAK